MDRKIPEIQARELLVKYNGANNYILNIKNKQAISQYFKMTRAQADYIIKYYNITPKIARKYAEITESQGKALEKTKFLPETPTKIWVEKLLCESDKAYHIWGYVTEVEPLHAFWIPKGAFVKQAKYIENNIDWSQFNHRPPMSHQISGVNYLLSNKKFILADEMGLGKTTTLTLSAILSGAKKILIICPATLKINWKREIQNYSDEKIEIIKNQQWDYDAKFVIINYDILKNHHQISEDKKNPLPGLHDYGFDLAIVDEAHYISNNKAQRSILTNDILDKIERVWLATGTPMTSRPINFYNLLKIVKSDAAINWKHYVTRYCNGYQFKPRNSNRKIWSTRGATNLDELRNATKSVMLRRLKSEAIDLPEKIITPIYLELNNSKYNQELFELARISEEGKTQSNITASLEQLTKIRQLISLEKIIHTIEVIDSLLEQDKKVVIFTNFTDTLNILYMNYKKQAVVLDGRMSEKAKQASVDEFQNNDKIRVFIGNIKAAGVGITLTAADTVVFNDLSFLPSDHAQAEDRCVFGGQEILTYNGYKNIADINVGEKVYTHNGNLKTVISTHTHLERKKIRVDINTLGYNDFLSLTHDHKVYVYDKLNDVFKWKECGNLDILNDYLTMKKELISSKRKEKLNIFENDYDSKQIKEKDGYILYPIKTLIKSKPKYGEERVYDLTIEDDHSFIVGNYNVHNCHRFGQINKVLIYYPIFENTIEMQVYNLLQEKKDNIEKVMGDGIYSENFTQDLIKQLF